MRCAAAVFLVLFARAAAAATLDCPEGGPIVIRIEPEAAGFVSADLVRQAIERDVGPASLSPIVGSRADGCRVLTIAAEQADRIVLRYRDRDGNTIERNLAPASDRADTAERIALIAVNLVHNEADKILEDLDNSAASRASAEASSPAAAQPGPDALSSVSASGVVSAERTRPVEETRVSHRWSFGALAYVWPRTAATVYTHDVGVFASRSLRGHFSVGATDIFVAPNAGRTVFSLGPFIEASWHLGRSLQPFGQIGVPMQGLVGGNRDAGFGAQPFLGAGIRLEIGGHTSIAFAARLATVVTDAYAAPPTELVRGTTSVTTGLELAFHL
jgi:hypothetical protein